MQTIPDPAAPPPGAPPAAIPASGVRSLIRPGRDLRIDFFRGLALWWIFADHVGLDWLGKVSLRNFALCDATEVFVLLAGYAGGIVYGKAMRRRGWARGAAQVVRRAWTLYVAHLFLFVVFAALVSWCAARFGRPGYLPDIHLDVLADAPLPALQQALLLRYLPSYLNILPLYVVLLLLFAPGLWLLRRPAVLAACSLALYAYGRFGAAHIAAWPDGTWYFNPLTWQLLFMAGAILSYAPPRWARPRRGWIDKLAVLVAVFGLLEQQAILYPATWTPHLPPWLARFLAEIDKEGLHPFRLLSIAALAWLTVRLVPGGARWLRGRAAAPFVLCGQNSLPVFCAGIVLCFAGRVALELAEARGGWGWTLAGQAGVNLGGAAGMVASAAVAAWFAAIRREPVPAPGPASRG